MRKLQLVKGNRNEDQPRSSTNATASGERRYRYPAEEIWEVSEEQWHRRDTADAHEKGIAAS